MVELSAVPLKEQFRPVAWDAIVAEMAAPFWVNEAVIGDDVPMDPCNAAPRHSPPVTAVVRSEPV